MCTSIRLKGESTYFGRNMDIEHSFGECIALTPRNYKINFREENSIENHYAILGTATLIDSYPLYADAFNEAGLCIAGLNFPDNAFYGEVCEKKKNITSFELIPWVLARFTTVDEALAELRDINVWNQAFNKTIMPTPLHWLLADKERAVTLEPTAGGLKIYENPAGVLTNNPPFEFHMHNIVNYINLTPKLPENRFSAELGISPYSLGMGAIGLPGDMSSASRFVRAAFVKFNSVRGNGEENVSRFFHILKSVAQPFGVTYTDKNEIEYTLYSSCCNASRGIYYYTTHKNSRITAVNMHNVDLSGDKVIPYPMLWDSDILRQN